MSATAIDYRLRVDRAAGGNAIHGLVRWASWEAVERDADARRRWSTLLHPQPGYPFTLRLRVEYALGAEGLTVRTTAENVGARALPVRRRHPPVSQGADRPRRRHGLREPLGAQQLDDPKRLDAPWRSGSTTSPCGPTRPGSTCSSSRATTVPTSHGVQPRGRADDVPAERVPDRRGPPPARAAATRSTRHVGHRAVRKKRLDVLLVERGLAESRTQAQALVMAGLVPGYDKPGMQVDESAELVGRRGRRRTSRAAARSSRTRSTRSVSIRPASTARPRRVHRRLHRRACCSAARRA